MSRETWGRLEVCSLSRSKWRRQEVQWRWHSAYAMSSLYPFPLWLNILVGSAPETQRVASGDCSRRHASVNLRRFLTPN